MKQTKNSSISLNIDNVSKNYGNISAVKNVSFSTKTGEIVAILGPNGAGKSTLMNMISGFLAPSSGKIFVNSNNVETDELKTKKDIGFLPEGSPLYSDMTVELFLQYIIALKLNLEYSETMSYCKIKNIYKEELERIILTSKINEVRKQKIETLSKGYLRRVGFAQSIIGNPPVLLLDEPTDGLDPNQKEHMRNIIKEMGTDKTILISTHLLDEAEDISNRIILINKGKIVIDDSLKNILRKTKTSSLKEAFKLLTNAE